MTDDPLKRLREDCPEWSDEYLAEQFSLGPNVHSPAAWEIVRSEALQRGLVSEAIARAMESEPSVGDRVLDSVHDHTKDWSGRKWHFAVLMGAVVAVLGAAMIAEYPVIGVLILGAAVGILRGSLRERAKERGHNTTEKESRSS